MVKLSLVQFSLNPVEVALRPEEGERSGRGSRNFSSEDDTDGNFSSEDDTDGMES